MVIILKKTIVTPRGIGHCELILPEGKTIEYARDLIDYAISKVLLERIIREQKEEAIKEKGTHKGKTDKADNR